MDPNSTDPIGRFGSGQAVRRIEDEGLLKGLGQYTDDVTLPRQTHGVFVRSPHAHARLGHAEEGSDGVMRATVRIPEDELVWEPGILVMPHAGVLELRLTLVRAATHRATVLSTSM